MSETNAPAGDSLDPASGQLAADAAGTAGDSELATAGSADERAAGSAAESADASPDGDSSAAGSSAAGPEPRPDSKSSMVLVVAAVVAVACALGLGLVLKQVSSSSDSPSVAGGVASQPGSPDSQGQVGDVVSASLPEGVDPESLAVRVAVNPSAPVLSVWEDFQCPACGAFEAASAGLIRDLVGQGKLVIEWRPVSFLDEAFNNDASSRATAAWGCAVDQGFAPQYHDVVFANQPVAEGQGFSDDQLLGFGSEAGMSGEALEEFTRCVESGRYLSWSTSSTGLFRAANLSRTPHATLDGEVVDVSVLVDPERLRDLVLSKQ